MPVHFPAGPLVELRVVRDRVARPVESRDDVTDGELRIVELHGDGVRVHVRIDRIYRVQLCDGRTGPPSGAASDDPWGLQHVRHVCSQCGSRKQERPSAGEGNRGSSRHGYLLIVEPRETTPARISHQLPAIGRRRPTHFERRALVQGVTIGNAGFGASSSEKKPNRAVRLPSTSSSSPKITSRNPA